MFAPKSHGQKNREQGSLQIVAWYIGAVDFVDLRCADKGITATFHYLRTHDHLRLRAAGCTGRDGPQIPAQERPQNCSSSSTGPRLLAARPMRGEGRSTGKSDTQPPGDSLLKRLVEWCS